MLQLQHKTVRTRSRLRWQHMGFLNLPWACLPSIGLLLSAAPAQISAQYQYPFQNPELPAEERITNALSFMTLNEKVDLLRFRAGVPRLGSPPLSSVEGLHG